jgi:hypothetical protein
VRQIAQYLEPAKAALLANSAKYMSVSARYRTTIATEPMPSGKSKRIL